jgi:hypothetical protein
MLSTVSTRLLITTTHNNPHSFPQAFTRKNVGAGARVVDNLVDYLGIIREYKADNFTNSLACGKERRFPRVLQQLINTK